MSVRCVQSLIGMSSVLRNNAEVMSRRLSSLWPVVSQTASGSQGLYTWDMQMQPARRARPTKPEILEMKEQGTRAATEGRVSGFAKEAL